MGRQAFGLIQRRRPTDVILEQTIELTGERGILPSQCRGLLQFGQGRHQGFRNVLATETTEAAMGPWSDFGQQAGGIRRTGGWQRAGHGSTAERGVSVVSQAAGRMTRIAQP